PGPDVGGGVAELAHHRLGLGAARAAIRDRERSPGSGWDLPAYDAVAAEQPGLDVEQVHGAAPAFGDSRRPPEKLGHDAARLDAARDRIAVFAIGGEQVVARLHRGHQADDGGFFAEVEVAIATDLGPLVHL